MGRKGKSIHGRVVTDGGNVGVMGFRDDIACQVYDAKICTVDNAWVRDIVDANASLIASAFNAATTCEDMGYDGEACVKALPELVAYALHATSILAALGDMPNITNEGIIIVDKCRG